MKIGILSNNSVADSPKALDTLLNELVKLANDDSIDKILITDTRPFKSAVWKIDPKIIDKLQQKVVVYFNGRFSRLNPMAKETNKHNVKVAGGFQSRDLTLVRAADKMIILKNGAVGCLSKALAYCKKHNINREELDT